MLEEASNAVKMMKVQTVDASNKMNNGGELTLCTNKDTRKFLRGLESKMDKVELTLYENKDTRQFYRRLE